MHKAGAKAYVCVLSYKVCCAYTPSNRAMVLLNKISVFPCGRERERHRHRHRHRERNRQKDRDRETESNRDRDINRHTETLREREQDRQNERNKRAHSDTKRKRETEKQFTRIQPYSRCKPDIVTAIVETAQGNPKPHWAK